MVRVDREFNRWRGLRWLCASGVGVVSLKSLIVSTSQTVTIPANVSMMWIMAAGGGGGATGSAPSGGSQGFAGGGAGEVCHMLCIPVTPGGTLVIVIGAGGLGQTNPNPASGGGDTTVGGFVLKGAVAKATWSPTGNTGGGPRGGRFDPLGVAESITHFGGAGCIDQSAFAIDGIGNGGNVGGIGNSSGETGGGAGTFWQHGGDGATAQGANGSGATGYGCGGGGGAGGGGTNGTTGGAGKDGVVILFWIDA